MNDGSVLGLASLAITGVLGVLTLYVNKRYDKRTIDLENQNVTQAKQIATLTTDTTKCKEEHAKCEEKHDTMESRVENIEKAMRIVRPTDKNSGGTP